MNRIIRYTATTTENAAKTSPKNRNNIPNNRPMTRTIIINKRATTKGTELKEIAPITE